MDTHHTARAAGVFASKILLTLPRFTWDKVIVFNTFGIPK